MTTPDLPDDVAALHALLLMAWAECDAERAKNGRLIEERDQLVAQNDRLRHMLPQLQRMPFCRRLGEAGSDQFNLALEDLEQAVAASEAEQEKADSALRRARSWRRRTPRGATAENQTLSPIQGKAVVARFDGGRLSSESGLLDQEETA